MSVDRRDDGMFESVVGRVVQVAIDGIGPFKGARELVDPHRRRGLTTAAVVDRVVRTQVTQAAAQGAVSGLGGLVTALAGLAPATAASMFVQARLTAAIAHAHGHDLDDPAVRDRIAAVVTGTSMSAGVQKAGREAGERAAKALVPRVQARAASRVAARAAVGRSGGPIATRVAASSAGKAIPVVGAVVGGAVDLAITRRVAEKARREFGEPLPPP
jgi:hypothetical protein